MMEISQREWDKYQGMGWRDSRFKLCSSPPAIQVCNEYEWDMIRSTMMGHQLADADASHLDAVTMYVVAMDWSEEAM